MKNNNLLFSIFLFVLILFLTSCTPGSGSSNSDDLAGFFMGIWHGWIAPVSLFMGFFNSEVRIYEVYNSGWWYDFGFYMAIISGFGGLSFFRKNKDD